MVDLPAPFGPMSPTFSPGFTANEASTNRICRPCCLVTLSSRITRARVAQAPPCAARSWLAGENRSFTGRPEGGPTKPSVPIGVWSRASRSDLVVLNRRTPKSFLPSALPRNRASAARGRWVTHPWLPRSSPSWIGRRASAAVLGFEPRDVSFDGAAGPAAERLGVLAILSRPRAACPGGGAAPSLGRRGRVRGALSSRVDGDALELVGDPPCARGDAGGALDGVHGAAVRRAAGGRAARARARAGAAGAAFVAARPRARRAGARPHRRGREPSRRRGHPRKSGAARLAAGRRGRGPGRRAGDLHRRRLGVA